MYNPNQQHQHDVVGPSDHYSTHPFDPTQQNTAHYTTSSTINANNNQTNGHKINSKESMNHFFNRNNNHQNDTAPDKKNNYSHITPQETKICVIVDSRTPVIIKIPLPASAISLSDFKAALPALDNPNFKYFFKSSDSEFGIVKEEIQDNDGRLPIYRGRIVAWVVTPNGIRGELTSSRRSDNATSNLTFSNTSYDTYDEATSSALTNTEFESSSYFTETDDEGELSSSFSETTCDTFIPQRRARHGYNNGTSPDRQKRPSYSYNKHRHMNNNNNETPSSSPTSSEQSQSDATAVHYVTVHLVLTPENFLGLHISSNTNKGVDDGITIDAITEGSAVARDGRIEPGDKLIQINDVNLEEMTNDEAVTAVKEAVSKRGPLKLVVAKFVESENLLGPKDEVHPIDTAAWVARTQALTIPQDPANSTTSSPSFDSYVQDTADFIRPASRESARMMSTIVLHRNKTDIKSIVQHMKIAQLGLDIRDREWLKISIPKAFLGSDLVIWLQRNVYGFNDHRDAKKYASRMLKEGYIKDPLLKKSFSEKSYYTFII